MDQSEEDELGGNDVVRQDVDGKKQTDSVLCSEESNKDNSPSIKPRPSLRECYKSRERRPPTLTAPT